MYNSLTRINAQTILALLQNVNPRKSNSAVFLWNLILKLTLPQILRRKTEASRYLHSNVRQTIEYFLMITNGEQRHDENRNINSDNEGDGDNVRANAGLLDDSSDNEELVQNGAAGPGAEIGNGVGRDAIDPMEAEVGQNLFPHDGKCRRSRKCHQCISSSVQLNGETRTQMVQKLTSQVGMFLF